MIIDRSFRIRSIDRIPPTPPNDEKIVAGYSDEMLKQAIRDLTITGDRRGQWENERLAFLNAEQKRRNAPKVEKKQVPALTA